MFFKLLGAAMFVSVGEYIFTNRLLQSVVGLAPHIDPKAVLGHRAQRLSNAFGQCTAVVLQFLSGAIAPCSSQGLVA